MPVTFTVTSQDAVPYPRGFISTDDIIGRASKLGTKNMEELLQTSVNPTDYPAVHLSPNGFVHTVLEAWGQHRNLVIRPDDVWMATLTQFHFYVNANSAKLRKSFVAHKGKKKLVIEVTAGSCYDVDFVSFARQMSGLLHDNDLVRWILPDFSTTTETDKTISAVILMATLKAYFTYRCRITCGIPRVTLTGEKSDWLDIFSRLDKFAEFGDQPHAWSHLLRTIITRFIGAFDSPTSQANVDFWRRIAHRHEPYCGAEFLSGWITAFCVWNRDGKWIGPDVVELLKGGVRGALPPIPTDKQTPKRLILDGRSFSMIKFHAIPPGYVTVDVEVDDHGQVFDCEMIAGHIGSHVLPYSAQVSASTEMHSDVPGGPHTTERLRQGEDQGFGNTVQPASAWFIFAKKTARA